MSSLSHHGVKGQKWGVRRYQNYDGTRTALGKRRDFERTALKVVEDSSNSPQPFVRRPFNKDKIRQRGLITQAEADQCAGLAAGVFKQASQVEPQITGDVIDAVSSTSAKMYGLNNRLKQPTSIAAKIGADAKADGITFEQAAGGLKDVIRYTAVSDSRDYVDTYNAIKQRLEEKGYTETKCKNYFQKYQNGEVMHKAVQSTFKSPDGVEFEFQFQTPESQAAKELKVPIYNERRKAGNTPERNAELEQEMRNLAEQVPDPEGVFGIESHSGAKNMKHSSLSHHGVEGQKWGVRRYQNKDGSLTKLGRLRLELDVAQREYNDAYDAYRYKRDELDVELNARFRKTPLGKKHPNVTLSVDGLVKGDPSFSFDKRKTIRELSDWALSQTDLYDQLDEFSKKETEAENKLRESTYAFEGEIGMSIYEYENGDFQRKRMEKLKPKYLSHHGVDGQQWGLRRYQYEDGTLTPLGREHYGYGDEEFQKRRTEAAKSRKEVLKNMDLFTTDELQELSARFNAEDQLKRENIEKGLQVMSDLAQVANNVYVIGSALGYFGAAEHSSLGGTMYDRQLEHSAMTGDSMLIVDGTLYLEHHGVTGQKHGVRRYQNYDGSLTALGRIHYGYGQARSKAGPVVTNALKKTGQAAGILSNAFKEARQAAAAASEERRERKQAKLKEKASRDRSSVLRNRNLFTTKELEDLEKRFTAEDKLRANIPDKKALRKAAADQKAAEKLAERKEKASQTREGVLRNKKLFTNEELKALSERFNTEDKIKQESIDKGLAVVKNLANAAQSVQTIVSVFEDVSGVNISPIKRAQAEQKKAWDLEDRQRKQHFEDTKEAREESKYKREEASAAAKDKRDIETWERDKQRADAKEQREIEQVEYNRKRDRAKDQRERAERLIKRRQDTEDRKRRLAREDAEDRRKAAEEIRKIKKEAAEERRKAISGKNTARKQKAEARLAEIKAIEAAMGLSNNQDLTDFEEWLRTIDPTWTRHDSFDSDYVIQNGVLLVNPQGSSLAHHGIKNQRWGVRRYQNYDGSLTPAGRERYGVGPEAGYNASINEDAIRASGHRYYAKKHPKNKIGYNDNPKDSEDAADKRRAEIAEELRKMGFKISENMTAEEHEAATAKILEKPYTEKKPLTAEDFRQIPDRFKVEAMTDEEKKELTKADFDGDKISSTKPKDLTPDNRRMNVPSDYRQQPGYKAKAKADFDGDNFDELEQLEADRLKRNREREEKLKKAKDSGEYDSDFEEAVMYNTYYSWGGTGGIDAKNKAYKNYLNNPQKFMDKANKKERHEIDKNRRTAEKYKRQSTEWQEKADRLRSSGNLEEARRLEAKATEARFWSEELTGMTDYREEKLQRRMKHSSMESNYIIQNGVLMINPTERR